LVDFFAATLEARQARGEVAGTLLCGGTTGCVGKILIVDEVTSEILAQIPRCHTC
jgi:hypothetical protein